LDRHTHIGVYGLILDSDKVLLIKKGRGPYTGKYDLPGGKIEFGETQIDALKREISEETGLVCSTIELIEGVSNRVQWEKPNGGIEDLHHLGFVYSVDIENKSYIKNTYDGHDSLGAIWISLKDINKDIVSPFAYRILFHHISKTN
jgi:8-oxo-dGTP diphosphatase